MRYRQSARGAAARFAAALRSGVLEQDVVAPVPRQCKGEHPPYHNVLPKTQLASQIGRAAEEVAARVPFDTVVQARDFIKGRLVAVVSTAGTLQETLAP